MDAELMIRRRATMEESQEELNNRLIQGFATLPSLWRDGKSVSEAIFNKGEEQSSLLLIDVLENAFASQVSYTARFPNQISSDRGMYDDFMILTINTEKTDCAAFCRETLPKLLDIFGAYLAKLETDKQIVLEDHDERVELYRRTRQRRDSRSFIRRMWPVNFFDDTLCRRAFGIGAEDVVHRAAPECEHAEHMLGGAFLLVTTDIVTGRPALDALHDRVMRRISPA